jgi:hypothetical protein
MLALVNSRQSTLHTKHNLKRKNPPSPPSTKKGEAPSLHDSTSHWLHGNSIPKIGGHYFWAGLIALPKNTLAFRSKVPPHWVLFMDIRFEPVKLKKLKSARTLSVGYGPEWGDHCNEATMRWEKSGLPHYNCDIQSPCSTILKGNSSSYITYNS